MSKIILPALCDRGAAEVVLPEMITAIGATPMAIDASACTRVGQAMLQLLVSARHTAGGASITASDELVDAARLAGLEHVLFDEVKP